MVTRSSSGTNNGLWFPLPSAFGLLCRLRVLLDQHLSDAHLCALRLARAGTTPTRPFTRDVVPGDTCKELKGRWLRVDAGNRREQVAGWVLILFAGLIMAVLVLAAFDRRLR
jgi:hypothetical protein